MGSRSAPYQDAPLDLSIRKRTDELPLKKATDTPSKINNFCDDILIFDDNQDITPIKNPYPLKRRSLMHEMNWELDKGMKEAKHPMEMRSRSCRRPKKDYCNPEEYDDYAEDLSFLFDDDLPELECRPRRKPRRKRSHLLSKKVTSESFSFVSMPEERTSENTVFDCFYDNQSKLDCDLSTCLSDSTMASLHSKIIESTNMDETFENSDLNCPVKRKNSFSSSFKTKRQKVEDQTEELNFRNKKPRKGSNSCMKYGARKLQGKKELKLDCEKPLILDSKVALTPIPESTVTKMMLRRRHSTPALAVSLEPLEKMPPRTTSFGNTKSGFINDKKGEKSPKISGEEDEIEFVDSPDSGFSSETSCSAGTPDVETSRMLTKCDVDAKHSLSRMSSEDSGITAKEEEGGLRLNLHGESILERQRQEQERKRIQEEEELRQKYRCLWLNCKNPYGNKSAADLHAHLEQCHVENYSCQWEGCKVFGKESRTLSFLQRHITEHSGEKPYKCILDGCDATFSSLCGRKRHVEAHYSEVSYPKARVGGDNSSFPRHILNSRRIKDKRKTLANRRDCMDNRTMTFIRSALIQNEVAMETEYAVTDPLFLRFQAEIMGRKSDARGQKYVLVKWKPENMISNEWILESESHETKVMKRTELTEIGQRSLKKLFFYEREPQNRKSKRPSLLKSMF